MNTPYLQSVLNAGQVFTGPNSNAVRAANKILPLIEAWGGNQITSINLSGSYAKGTAVKGGTDVDLFISLTSTLGMSTGQVYNSLLHYLRSHGYPSARAQNVSIGLIVNGCKVDLVPAKRQNPHNGDHSLYKRKTNTWTKTNIQKHIKVVSESGRLSEIRLMKLWRNQKRMDFPSFYLELSVINALTGKGLLSSTGNLDANVRTVLHYLKNDFQSAKIIDPANASNIISNDMSVGDKQLVSKAASMALLGSWTQFVS